MLRVTTCAVYFNVNDLIIQKLGTIIFFSAQTFNALLNSFAEINIKNVSKYENVFRKESGKFLFDFMQTPGAWVPFQ